MRKFVFTITALVAATLFGSACTSAPATSTPAAESTSTLSYSECLSKTTQYASLVSELYGYVHDTSSLGYTKNSDVVTAIIDAGHKGIDTGKYIVNECKHYDAELYGELNKAVNGLTEVINSFDLQYRPRI